MMRLVAGWTRRLVSICLAAVMLGSWLIGPLVTPASGHLGEATFVSVVEPVGVAATPGRLLVTRPFCGDPRQVVSIDDAGVVSLFATLPPRGGVCSADGIAVAGPADPSKPGFPSPTLGGFPSNFAFVTQGARILQLTTAGVVSTFATLPSCGSANTGITFDHVGTFGYNMLLTCSTGKVWKVTSAGAAVLVADVASSLGLASVKMEYPDVAPQGFTPYGGHLLVAAPVLGQVLAVSPAGGVSAIAGWSAAQGVNVIPQNKCNTGATGGTFFAAIFRPASQGSGSIVRFPISAFSGLSGRGLVTSEGSAGIGLLTPTGGSTIIPTLFHASIGKLEGSTFADCTVPMILKIIVKPGSIPHTINPGSGGTVPVAILSSASYNALTDTVLSSIRFGFTGTENSIVSCNASGQDFNADGRLDLLCHGETQKLGIPGNGPYRGPLIVKLTYIAPTGDPIGEGAD